MPEQIWREPPEESTDLYPGLVVHDGRVSGSITLGRSRMPLWAFIYEQALVGFEAVKENYAWTQTGAEGELIGEFLTDLLEMRGEFARLLLVLADAERCERVRGMTMTPWWRTKRHRKRIRKQLERCLECLQ